MARARLRIFYGPPSDLTDPTDLSDDGANDLSEHESHARRTVDVTLGEIFPVLSEAMRSRRAWLRDFESDLVTISSDLYEAILAYQHYRPSA